MSQQVIYQLPPSGDSNAAVASGSYEDVNLGASSIAVIGTTQIGKGSSHYRYLLRFALTGLPSGTVIVGASLTLSTNIASASVGQQFSAYRLTQPGWTALGVTWNVYDGAQAWQTPGGDYVASGAASFVPSTSGDDLVFAGLASLVTDAMDNQDGMLNLLVVGPESSGTSYVAVFTAEETDPQNRPRLVVEYVLPAQLAITDHGDASGATATIADAEEESQTRVWVRSFDGELGDGQWTLAATVDGNGSAELSLPAGHYFAYAVSTVGEVQVASRVVYFAVTDGLASIHSRCLEAVQARIRLLALEGIDNQRVVIEKVPAGRNLSATIGLPAIVLSPERAAMPTAEGTNGADDVHYDVLVAIFDRDNQEPTLQANLGRHMLWRQQIARAFRNQRLSGVPEVINSEVEPAEGLLDEAWKRELMASALRLRFTSREPRGF